jgi:hypothetical protein
MWLINFEIHCRIAQHFVLENFVPGNLKELRYEGVGNRGFLYLVTSYSTCEMPSDVTVKDPTKQNYKYCQHIRVAVSPLVEAHKEHAVRRTCLSKFRTLIVNDNLASSDQTIIVLQTSNAKKKNIEHFICAIVPFCSWAGLRSSALLRLQ